MATTMKKAPKLKMLKEDKKSEWGDGLPTLHLDEKHLPEIKDWKIGEEYMLDVKVKMTNHGIQDYGDNKGNINATFKIVGIAADKDEK